VNVLVLTTEPIGSEQLGEALGPVEHVQLAAGRPSRG
jgi:hypothetical protein